MNHGVSPAHLGLLKVEVLADGREQSAQTLQRLLVVILEQLDDAVVHDGFGQHLELEQLTDELDVADGTPPRLVLGLLQLFLEPLALRRLKHQTDIAQQARAAGGGSCSFLRHAPMQSSPALSASSQIPHRPPCLSQTPSGSGLAAVCGSSPRRWVFLSWAL